MTYRSYSPNPQTALEELRERIPNLNPYVALTLTLEPMLLRGEISTEEYLKWSAALIAAQDKPLFSAN